MAQGPPDAELVRRVRDADGAALSQLYQRLVRPCYSLARRICADEKLADDVVQKYSSPCGVIRADTTQRGADSPPGCSR